MFSLDAERDDSGLSTKSDEIALKQIKKWRKSRLMILKKFSFIILTKVLC